jgi:hypothetical protein
MRADTGNAFSTAEVPVKVVAPVAGRPTVRIIRPLEGLRHTAINGVAKLHLEGRARDAKDGAVPGTRMRWVARTGKHRRVLCTGSSFPGSGNGGIVQYRDCRQLTAQVPLPPTAGLSSAWAIELEAADREENIGTRLVISDVVAAIQ